MKQRTVRGEVIVERTPRDVVGHVECGEVSDNFAGLGISLRCQKEWGHADMHGSDPFVEYGSSWPNEASNSPYVAPEENA